MIELNKTEVMKVSEQEALYNVYKTSLKFEQRILERSSMSVTDGGLYNGFKIDLTAL